MIDIKEINIKSILFIFWIITLLGCINTSEQGNFTQTKKEVQLEFLYADWCVHCNNMKPIVLELARELPPDRFELIMLNEKDIANPKIKEVYEKYTEMGFFKGFPTFVINGETALVGERSKQDFNLWVCAHFKPPKPTKCSS
ncbi:MAG: thioredoxin domain-containing protein [Candidatus Anstonellales archaeon]